MVKRYDVKLRKLLTIYGVFVICDGMNAPVIIASAYRQLSNAERAFVDGYVSDLERSGEPVARAWQYAPSPSDIAASRGMLGRPLVCAAISECVREIVEKTELTPRRLIREIMAVGFSNLQDYFQIGEDGQPRIDLTNLTRDQWAALSGMDLEMDPRDPTRVRNIKIRLHPKMDAIAKLGDYMAALRPDNPYWKGQEARTIDNAALPANADQSSLSDRYAAMING